MRLYRSKLASAVRVLAWFSLASTVSCATYSDKTELARDALRGGNYEGSVKHFNKVLKVRSAEALPDKWKKNFELVVLERAMVLQAMGLYELSARDFGVAEKKLEFLDLARDGAGKIGKYIYSDSATKYKTTPTEKLSINALNMVNYLARGDLSGAKVEAKRFTTMRNYFADYDPEHEHGAFGSYLAGFVYERLGRADTALRYYEEALQERDFGSLAQPIARLAKIGTFRGERIKDYLPRDEGNGAAKPVPKPVPETKTKSEPAATVAETPPVAETDAASDSPDQTDQTDKPDSSEGGTTTPPLQRPSPPTSALASLPVSSTAAWTTPESRAAEILVIAKTGRVPFKIPKRIPIGAAVGLAGAFVTGDTTLLEYGMFKVLTYPELESAKNRFVDATLSIDGAAVPLEEATDIAHEVVREFDELRPKIIGAALTRMIV
ncbi:MAG: hypothetical protein JKY37_24665, partial [Nannocystaceae bacterium]|nr:hypothetical protein [Nannocystaceae bacterium]